MPGTRRMLCVSSAMYALAPSASSVKLQRTGAGTRRQPGAPHPPAHLMVAVAVAVAVPPPSPNPGSCAPLLIPPPPVCICRPPVAKPQAGGRGHASLW